MGVGSFCGVLWLFEFRGMLLVLEFLCSGCWEFLWCVVGVGSFGGVL